MQKDISNIFSQEIRNYVLTCANPSKEEKDRVRKEIFQKLETRYPQFRHRRFFSVENIFQNRFTFGFSIVSVICIVIFFYSQMNQGVNQGPEELTYQGIVSPNETVLVQSPNQNELVAIVENDFSSETKSTDIVKQNIQHIQPIENTKQVKIVDHTSITNISVNEAKTAVQNLQLESQVNHLRPQPVSIARNEGSVISASQYTSPELPSTQFEYLVRVGE